MPPHPLRGLPGPPLWLDVGPRNEEGHGAGVVDPRVDQLDDVAELLFPQQAELQTWRADDEVEQGPERGRPLPRHCSAPRLVHAELGTQDVRHLAQRGHLLEGLLHGDEQIAVALGRLGDVGQGALHRGLVPLGPN